MKYKVTFIVPIASESLIHMAANLIESILNQSGSVSFEILVSNNGKNPIVRNFFKSNYLIKHIKYLEPPSFLKMSEHFEWASKLGSGEYILVIPPRRLLKQNALITMVNIMDKNPECPICCGSFDEWDDKSRRLFLKTPSKKGGVITSKSLINKFLKGSYASRACFWNSHPTALNGIVRRSFLERMRKIYPNGYFDNISPDVSSGFKCLLNSKNIYVIDQSIFVITNRQASTGNKTVLSFKSDYFRELGDAGIFIHLPDELNGSTYASIIEDFIRQRFEYARINNVDYSKTELSNHFLKETAFEFFLKLLFNKFEVKNLKRVLAISKILHKFGVTYFELFSKLMLAFIVAFYFRSPHLIKLLISNLRPNSMKYDNLFTAAGFQNFKKSPNAF